MLASCLLAFFFYFWFFSFSFMPFLLESDAKAAVSEFVGEGDVGGMNEVLVDEPALLVHTF